MTPQASPSQAKPCRRGPARALPPGVTGVAGLLWPTTADSPAPWFCAVARGETFIAPLFCYVWWSNVGKRVVVARVRLDPELLREAYGLGLDVAGILRRAFTELASARLVLPSYGPWRKRWPPVRVRVPRRVWEALVWRFGSLSAVAAEPEFILDYHVKRMRELMAMTDDEIMELLWSVRAPDGGPLRKVKVVLPKAVVEAARESGVAVGPVVKRALCVFAAKNLPPMSPAFGPDVPRARVWAWVPRPVAEKLSKVGGPSRAWWFVARALLACARKAREVVERGG